MNMDKNQKANCNLSEDEKCEDKAAAAEEVATCNSNGMDEKKAVQILADENSDEEKRGEADSFLAAVDAAK